MSRSPSFQFYPGDWLRNDVSGCSLEAQGLWLRMMIIMHDAQIYGQLVLNNEPMSPEFVAKKVGISRKKYANLVEELEFAGVINRKENGVIFSGRMERDEHARQQNRVRQAKHRDDSNADSNADVTPDVTPMSQPSHGESNGALHSSSSSSSSSSEEKKEEKPLSTAAAEKEVFEYWQKLMNHPKVSLTKERRTKIKARLKNYSVDDIKQAIDGCKQSPYHMGQNDRNTVYNDIELICRNDTNLEKFIYMNGARPQQQNGSAPSAPPQHSQEELKAMYENQVRKDRPLPKFNFDE